MLQRKAAPKCRLAQQQHCAGILVAGCDLTQRGGRDRIERPFTEGTPSTRNQVSFVDCVEKLDRPPDLAPRHLLAPTPPPPRRGPQDDVFVTKPCARELAIVSG